MIPPLTSPLEQRCASVMQEVPGYSDFRHYLFFHTLLHSYLSLNKMLMLGVYQGRDMAFILEILENDFPSRPFTLLGVDKFSDTPCADWPKDRIEKGWELAGYGKPPDMHTAYNHLEPRIKRLPNCTIGLVKQTDVEFFEHAKEIYDIIYLDTSHDEETVCRQIASAKRLGHEETILCGDDFSDAGTWGVKKAVESKFFKHFQVWQGWVFYALLRDAI